MMHTVKKTLDDAPAGADDEPGLVELVEFVPTSIGFV
jgi:hypothetical protein